jgi:hypothetical protein
MQQQQQTQPKVRESLRKRSREAAAFAEKREAEQVEHELPLVLRELELHADRGSTGHRVCASFAVQKRLKKLGLKLGSTSSESCFVDWSEPPKQDDEDDE